eukprot:2584358-Pyramimonas_sp.AAC.1
MHLLHLRTSIREGPSSALLQPHRSRHNAKTFTKSNNHRLGPPETFRCTPLLPTTRGSAGSRLS